MQETLQRRTRTMITKALATPGMALRRAMMILLRDCARGRQASSQAA